jgi:hypothetical protein
LRRSDLAHGVVKGQAKDLDKEVDGVACQLSLRPAPVAVFDDDAGMCGQFEVARLPGDELESAFLQKRNQEGDAGGTDLVAAPAGSLRTATMRTATMRLAAGAMSIRRWGSQIVVGPQELIEREEIASHLGPSGGCMGTDPTVAQVMDSLATSFVDSARLEGG